MLLYTFTITPNNRKVEAFVKHFELPVEKGAVTLIDPENMDELVRLLHEEAKVI